MSWVLFFFEILYAITLREKRSMITQTYFVVRTGSSTSRSNLILADRCRGRVTVRITDRNSHAVAHRIAVIALDVIGRSSGARCVGRFAAGSLGREAVTVRITDRNSLAVAHRIAVIALDVIGQYSR